MNEEVKEILNNDCGNSCLCEVIQCLVECKVGPTGATGATDTYKSVSE